jgi:hypothetical protein
LPYSSARAASSAHVNSNAASSGCAGSQDSARSSTWNGSSISSSPYSAAVIFLVGYQPSA